MGLLQGSSLIPGPQPSLGATTRSATWWQQMPRHPPPLLTMQNPRLVPPSRAGVCKGLGGGQLLLMGHKQMSLRELGPSSFGALLCSPFCRGSHSAVPASSPQHLHTSQTLLLPAQSPGTPHPIALSSPGPPSRSGGHPGEQSSSCGTEVTLHPLPVQTSQAGLCTCAGARDWSRCRDPLGRRDGVLTPEPPNCWKTDPVCGNQPGPCRR